MHSRRQFLLNSVSHLSATWLASQWPAAFAAAQHAHRLAQSGAVPKFDFFTPEQATEIDSIAARIIPTDETPGARDAGVVYFIDRALTTFASEWICGDTLLGVDLQILGHPRAKHLILPLPKCGPNGIGPVPDSLLCHGFAAPGPSGCHPRR